MNVDTESSKGTLLIVDDHPDSLQILSSLLSEQGYKVRVATDGTMALISAQSNPPDLILLDIMMPVMDGYEVCQKLKSHERTEQIPVIFFSAKSEIFDKQKAFEVGGVDYLTKPIDIREIIVRIENQLKIWRLQQQLTQQNEQLQQEIRERKKIEEATLLLTNQLQEAQRIAHIGNWEFDTVNQTMSWSAELFQIYGRQPGLPPTFDELLQQIYPEDRSGWLNSLEQAMALGKPYNIDYRIYLHRGEIRYINGKGQAIKSEEGHVLRLVGTVTDITDRKLSEQLIIESERRFRAIFEYAPVGIMQISPEGNLLKCNPGFCKIIGVSELELKTKTCAAITEVEDWKIEQKYYQQLLEGDLENYSLEKRFIHENGQKIWTHVTTSLVRLSSGKPNYIVSIIEDISDRKNLEKELAVRENQIKAFFKGAPVGMAIMDQNARFLQINEPLAEINGFSIQEHLGKNIQEIIPSLSTEIESLYESVLTTGIPIINYEISGEVPSQPGIIRHWVASYFPILGENNIIESTGVVVVEITDRKRAELELQSVRARLEHLLAVSPAVIFSCKINENFALTFMSENVYNITGYPAQKFLENSHFGFHHIHPEDRQNLWKNFPLLSLKGYDFHEYRFLHSNGTYHWLYSELRLIKDSQGNPLEIVGYGIDISDRKQAESALKESVEREKAFTQVIQRMRQSLDVNTIFNATTSELREVLKSDRVAIYRLHNENDQEFIAQSFAPHWQSILVPSLENSNSSESYHPEETNISSILLPTLEEWDKYLCQTFFKINSLSENDSEKINYIAISDIYQEENHQEETLILECLQIRAYLVTPIFSGSQLWGLLITYQKYSPHHWSEAEINMVMQIGTQLGVALQQVELLEYTKKQSEELQKAVMAADGANRAKSIFLTNMSHELRTPLNAILGFTELMGHDDSLSSGTLERLAIINRAGEHLLSLINNILEMSKIEAGRNPLKLQVFDLFNLVISIKNMLEFRANSQQLKIELNWHDPLPTWIETDEGKLRQVLINLLGNAIKFTKKGGVTISVSSTESPDNTFKFPREYSPTPHQNPQLLKIEIADTGVGISPEELPLIFEAFTQTESGRKSSEGTGLGLPISRKFIQMMGGEILVESQRETGSKFTILVPIKPSPNPENPPSFPQQKVIKLAPNQPDYKILVVEDHADSRLLLVTLLTQVGFIVKEAENGQEAIEIWQNWYPDLIWMDMRMPIMNGYEATETIKANLRDQKTIIVAITASAFEENRAMVLAAGCDDFVRKPFREEVIFDIMAKHLGVRYLYQQNFTSPTLTPPPEKLEPKLILTPENLHTIPREYCQKLHEAARAADDTLLEPLITQIRDYAPEIAQSLEELIYNFQYETIMELTQNFSP